MTTSTDGGSLIRPEEGAHGKLPLVLDIADRRKAVLPEEAVELPLRHRLIVSFGIPGIVQWHLEATRASSVLWLLMLAVAVCHGANV